MKNNIKKLLIIAPGHSENDARVNRTIKIFAQLFDCVNVIYESRFSLNYHPITLENVNFYYIVDTEPLFKVIPRLFLYKKFILKNDLLAENIYIHDSGLLGLFIAEILKKSSPSVKKIIFDYHDLIQWEIYYQTKKIATNSTASKYIGKLILNIILLFFSRKKITIDGLVGISRSQIDNFFNLFKCCDGVPFIVVPNTRRRIEYSYENKMYNDKLADFLWVGNIVNGRDLSSTIQYLDQLIKKYDFKFYIFGRNNSSEVFRLLEERSYCKYIGEFLSDYELFQFIHNKKVIALFFGWDDKFNVGINKIASPNKVYSYLNFGAPVLLKNNVNPQDFKKFNEIGCAFDNFLDFEDSYLHISNNYGRYKLEFYKLRNNFIWDEDLNFVLKNFFLNLYFDT